MKLTAKTEYACLAMLQLAAERSGCKPMPIKALSAKQDIPEGFLVQILQDLRRAGLVTSTRGASGGYQLARESAAISLAEVIEAIEGREPEPIESPATNPLADALHSVCHELQQQQQQRLDDLSLADMVEQAAVGAEPMWYI
ncbi:MAG: Rrf2 family transcriptional regulator [Planctomycetota bacterium]